MRHRIMDILLVGSPYDSFVLEDLSGRHPTGSTLTLVVPSTDPAPANSRWS